MTASTKCGNIIEAHVLASRVTFSGRSTRFSRGTPWDDIDIIVWLCQDAFGLSVRFHHESGAYADLDAGGACIGILCNDAAKTGKFPVELVDPEVRVAGVQLHWNRTACMPLDPPEGCCN